MMEPQGRVLSLLWVVLGQPILCLVCSAKGPHDPHIIRSASAGLKENFKSLPSR